LLKGVPLHFLYSTLKSSKHANEKACWQHFATCNSNFETLDISIATLNPSLPQKLQLSERFWQQKI
jgi:hypothetical protein